jgi:acetyl esterase/lipase
MRVSTSLRTVTIAIALTVGAGSLAAQDSASAPPTMRADGTLPVRAYNLPVSRFLSPEARNVYIAENRTTDELLERCTSGTNTEKAAVALRRCIGPLFEKSIAKLKARYPVKIEPKTIGGIYTEVVTPAAGIAPENKNRVLIDVHGGGFTIGSRTESQVESIPIAAVGKIKVVSVDYRLAPEHQFPAASQDVAAVYRALLKEYQPKNIGIYGCSAGGLLTAQSLAWFQKEGLPTPGAAGMFCAAAAYWDEGDSGYYVNGGPQPPNQNPYLKNADLKDPLVFPLNSPAVLAKFPPSLLVVATRDFALSSVVQTHSELVRLGVDADLHVWEGLGHAFFFNPDLPQSREMYDVTVKFFDKHLGK